MYGKPMEEPMPQSDFWNKLLKRLREVSAAAADFTEEQAIIGKLKFEILTLKRKVDHRQREIGVRMCEMSSMDPLPKPWDDREIKRLLREIGDLEKQVEQKRVDIGKVANQVRSKSSAGKVATTAKAKPTPGTARKTAARKKAKPKAQSK